jgi:hypothetical protein
MKLYKMAVIIFSMIFICLNIRAFTIEPLLINGLYKVVNDCWGLVAFYDLNLGSLVFSSIVYLNEKSKPKAFIWIFFMFVSGNIISAIYLLLNLEKIKLKLETV